MNSNIIIYIFGLFGLYCAARIIWYETTDPRYRLKTKLFPKYKAYFKKGDFVSVDDAKGKDTLCIVKDVYADNNDGKVTIWYCLEATYAFNENTNYEWFDNMNFEESEVRQVW